MRKTFRLLVALLLASSLYSCTQYDTLPMGTRLRFLGGDYEYKEGVYTVDDEKISDEYFAQVTLDVFGYSLTITDGLHNLVKDVFLDFGKFKGTIEDDGTKTYYINLDRMYVCFTTDEENYIELFVQTEEFTYKGLRGYVEEDVDISGVYLITTDNLYALDESITLRTEPEISTATTDIFNNVDRFIVVSLVSTDVYCLDCYIKGDSNYELLYERLYFKASEIGAEKTTLYNDDKCTDPIIEEQSYVTTHNEATPRTIYFYLWL